MVFAAHFLLVMASILISIIITFLYIGVIHLDDKLIKKYKGSDYASFVTKRILIFFVMFFVITLIILEFIFFALP